MIFFFERFRKEKTMARDDSKTAYIKTERVEKSIRYIAKVFDREPCVITKAQYNQIVKALRLQDWRNTDEDETVVINQIINRSLEPTESAEDDDDLEIEDE